MSPPRKPKKAKEQEPEGITRITVKGFKSLANETSIEIRPLTILAGANSSGKSSIMQPLLLLKQTLDDTADFGPVKLGGPHVRFDNAAEMFSRDRHGEPSSGIAAGFEDHRQWSVRNDWERAEGRGVSLRATHYGMGTDERVLLSGMGHEEVSRIVEPELERVREESWRAGWCVLREGCFLGLSLRREGTPLPLGLSPWGFLGSPKEFAELVRAIIHLSGLRGSPERVYRATATGPLFPDTFEHYTASLVDAWQEAEREQVVALEGWLESLGLASRISTRRPKDTEIEVLVSRLPGPTVHRADDLVNVADVGFGVSQALPVLVALLAADPGRLVYIEQPELHLHPRAQVALAQVLVDAANRGVRVVAETHSSLLLQALQTLVAKPEGISPDKVVLHWFERGDDGVTQVTRGSLSKRGSFGDWPVDFGDVTLEAQAEYLEAIEALSR
jgi:hypothetical protein